MKRIMALALALVLIFALTACGKQDKETKDMTDLQYIQNKGKLVVGITEFEPMVTGLDSTQTWLQLLQRVSV